MKENVWIGIGLNIKSSDFGYSDFVELNRYLVEKYGCKYIFDPVTLHPHVNLYDIDVPSKNLDKIAETLNNIAKKSEKVKVTLDEIDFFDYGAVFIKCLLDSLLVDLERKVVTDISKYREGVITREYWVPWIKYNENQVKNRERYGSPHTFDTYKPHMTIGFVKDKIEVLNDIKTDLNKRLKIKELLFNGIDFVVHDDMSKLVESRFFEFKG